MGFGGYLNPFTLEIQVNSLMPKTSLAITIPHEQAHQLGYAAENEANFIGFLACIYNKDLYYQYTGYSFALRYCLQEFTCLFFMVHRTLLMRICTANLFNILSLGGAQSARKKQKTNEQAMYFKNM